VLAVNTISSFGKRLRNLVLV